MILECVYIRRVMFFGASNVLFLLISLTLQASSGQSDLCVRILYAYVLTLLKFGCWLSCITNCSQITILLTTQMVEMSDNLVLVITTNNRNLI